MRDGNNIKLDKGNDPGSANALIKTEMQAQMTNSKT